MITKKEIRYKFPKVKFYLDGKYKFTVDNEVELNNIRVAALYEGWTNRISFTWHNPTTNTDEPITINERGDLSRWSDGLYNQPTKQLLMILRHSRPSLMLGHEEEPWYLINQ